MTVITENKTDATLPQEKVETKLPVEKVEATTESKPDSVEDPNWRAFREARKTDRLKTEAAEKKAAEKEAEVSALKAAMEAAFNKSQPQQQYQNYQQPEDESEDQVIEKKVQAAIAKREAESERARREREHQEYPQKLVERYSDFNEITTTDNLDYLEYHYPEVASPLKRLQDGFDKWSDIYKALKKFIPNIHAKKDSLKADQNFNKPKSMSSSTMTPPGETKGAYQLSQERKAANWERMQKSLKGVN